MMKKALFVMNWVAFCGLCVAATLLLPKDAFRSNVLEVALEETSWRRPEVLPNFVRSVRNEEGKFESPSFESMRELGTEWAKYAMQLETRHDFSKSLLRQRAGKVRTITILFWVTFTLLLLNVVASLRAFFTPRPNEALPKEASDASPKNPSDECM